MILGVAVALGGAQPLSPGPHHGSSCPLPLTSLLPIEDQAILVKHQWVPFRGAAVVRRTQASSTTEAEKTFVQKAPNPEPAFPC